MSTLLHGWRRKLGLLMLVMALGFVGLCGHGQISDDSIGLATDGYYFYMLENGISIVESHSSIFGPATLSARQIAFIPYWTIIIPLTVLSAYLLLSKPRVAKS